MTLLQKMNGEWTDTDAIERELRCAALDQLHAAQQRIASLEAQLAAAREEIRRVIHYAVITEEAEK